MVLITQTQPPLFMSAEVETLKSISLAQSHYGSLSYILAYAASGFDCDIHLMNTDGQVRPADLHFVC